MTRKTESIIQILERLIIQVGKRCLLLFHNIVFDKSSSPRGASGWFCCCKEVNSRIERRRRSRAATDDDMSISSSSITPTKEKTLIPSVLGKDYSISEVATAVGGQSSVELPSQNENMSNSSGTFKVPTTTSQCTTSSSSTTTSYGYNPNGGNTATVPGTGDPLFSILNSMHLSSTAVNSIGESIQSPNSIVMAGGRNSATSTTLSTTGCGVGPAETFALGK